MRIWNEKIFGGEDFVLVDIETTGSDHARDGIIDVGILRYSRGVEVATYQKLIRPDKEIPEFIEKYTGVTNAMVEGESSFEDCAAEIFELLRGAVFVAHNVSFDYEFLRNKLAVCGYEFIEKALCSVQLSRSIFPNYKKHSLDALIDRYGFECESRHRAMADAKVVKQFFEHLEGEFAVEFLANYVQKQFEKQPVVPVNLRRQIDKLPKTFGVFSFYDDQNRLLYASKGKNLRSCALAHFAPGDRIFRSLKKGRKIGKIDFFETTGLLGAALEEFRLVNIEKPLFKRKACLSSDDLCTLRLCFHVDGCLKFEIVGNVDLKVEDLDLCYGVFHERGAALDYLRSVANLSGLCLEKLSIKKGEYLKTLGGEVCAEGENVENYNKRLKAIFENKRLVSWPFGGRVGFLEKDYRGGRANLHVFDNWCHVATLQREEEIYDFENLNSDLKFDLGVYQLLVDFLQKGKRLRVVKI